MNNKLIKLLAFSCMGLCLIIAGEYLYASYAQQRLLTSISAQTPQDYKIDALPEIKLGKQPEESYADLVTRPLFLKGRRPVDEPGPESKQAADLAAAAKSLSFDWQLNGVYGTKKNLSALFSRVKTKVAKDNHRKITLGNDLDGWKLTQITKDKIILKQGMNEKELLLRKPKAKGITLQENSPAALPPAIPVAPAPEPPANTNEETSEEN